MNQTPISGLAGVMEIVRSSGLLSSLCTITESPEAFDAGGAPIAATAYVPVSGLENIPCTAPPLMTTDRVQASEIRMLRQIQSEDSRHVLLDSYYPMITERNRALIDGVEYDIANVEHDSQKQMTRLAVERVSI
jgi:hypothetical protein